MKLKNNNMVMMKNAVLNSSIKLFKRKAVFILLKLLSKSREKMAEFAYKNTVFYREIYRDAVMKKGKITNVPFRKLPLAAKSSLNQYLPFDLLAKPYEKKVFKYGETTGSTGSPTPSFFTRKEFYGSVVLAKLTPYAALLGDILKLNRRAVCGLACGFTIAGLSFQQVLDELGFLTVNVDARTTIAPPHRVARLLARFKPSVIAAGETDFLAWMKVLKEEYSHEYEDVTANLKALVSTAELCSGARSAMIEKEFGIIHIDNYACVEGYFSVPCPCGEKHILPVYETEVLSDDLKQSCEFGKGRFVFTNLYRKSTPFVRYLLDDLVTIYPSSCSHGFKKSIIPHGRYELSVNINGIRYGTRDFEEVLFQDYLFGEYRVEIFKEKIIIQVEDYNCGTNVPMEKIKRDFKDKFKMETMIKLYPYGRIRNYKKIRETKPVLRLQDHRESSTQKIPQYL